MHRREKEKKRWRERGNGARERTESGRKKGGRETTGEGGSCLVFS